MWNGELQHFYLQVYWREKGSKSASDNSAATFISKLFVAMVREMASSTVKSIIQDSGVSSRATSGESTDASEASVQYALPTSTPPDASSLASSSKSSAYTQTSPEISESADTQIVRQLRTFCKEHLEVISILTKYDARLVASLLPDWYTRESSSMYKCTKSNARYQWSFNMLFNC